MRRQLEKKKRLSQTKDLGEDIFLGWKKNTENDGWRKGEDAKNKRFVKRDVETSSEKKKTNTNKRSGWGHILRWKKNYRIWWMKKRWGCKKQKICKERCGDI